MKSFAVVTCNQCDVEITQAIGNSLLFLRGPQVDLFGCDECKTLEKREFTIKFKAIEKDGVRDYSLHEERCFGCGKDLRHMTISVGPLYNRCLDPGPPYLNHFSESNEDPSTYSCLCPKCGGWLSADSEDDLWSDD